MHNETVTTNNSFNLALVEWVLLMNYKFRQVTHNVHTANIYAWLEDIW